MNSDLEQSKLGDDTFLTSKLVAEGSSIKGMKRTLANMARKPKEVVMDEKKELEKVDVGEGKAISLVSQDMQLGKIFAESKMFPDIVTAAQGYIKILAGRELGLSPIQALNSFYFVAGRLAILAQAMGALVKRSGKYDYKIDVHTEQECTISFYKTNGEKEKIGESKFDLKMAAKAGLVNKNNWKNYPMNLLFARALTNGIRWFCPDAVSAFIYTVEELRDLEPDAKTEVITISKDNKVIKKEE